MAKSRMDLLDEIQAFMRRHVSPPAHWYVGTAKVPRAQLFDVHGFKPNDIGLYRQTTSDNDAASIAGFIMKGGSKGDSVVKPGADYVYVFKMNGHTKPAI
ncbi:MAG: hypothetical protein EPO08_18065 [Rhodospirillaceae bacterium]|nr:MAG: hypothetical protein EPO08_18065 [Rhodospirillaceae bacterium]